MTVRQLIPHLRIPGTPLLALVGTYFALLLLRAAAWPGTGVDEALYYAQLVAPIWDGSLDFSRTVAESRNMLDVRLEGVFRLFGDEGPDLPFSVGPGLAMSPLLLFGQALDAIVGGRLGDHERYTYFYRFLASSACWTAVLLGLIAAWTVARRYTSEWRATALCLLLFLGTNLSFYTWDAPLMSHGFSFAAVAFLVLAAVRYTEHPGLWRAFLMGAMVGLAFLMRWQDVLAGVIALVAWFVAMRRHGMGRRSFAELAAAGAGAFLFVMPQLAMWRAVFGSWIVVPQGTGFFVWEWERLYRVLFSPLNGWIFTHPIVLGALGALGFCLYKRTAWAVTVAVVTALFVIMNSLPGDWWAGGSFGHRRFIGLYAMLLIPAAQVAGHLSRRTFGLVCAAGGVLVWLNLREVFRSAWEPLLYGGVPGRMVSWDFGNWDVLGWRWFLPGRWFTSDIFAHPTAVDGPVTVVVLFVLGTVGVVLVSLAVHRVFRTPALAGVATGVTVLYLLFWSSILLLLDIPQREERIEWFASGRGLAIEKQYAELGRDKLARHDAGEEILPGLPQIMVLTGLLVEERLDEADEYSKELEARYPRMLLDVWTRHAPRPSPERNHWIERMLDPRDLPPETLHVLFSEAALERQEEAADELRRRLAGPRWRRDVYRLQEEVLGGMSTERIREALARALRSNPTYLPTRIEAMELERNRPERFAEHRAAADSMTGRSHDFLDYLSADKDAYVSVISNMLAGQAWFRLRPMLIAGDIAEAHEELEFFESLGFDEDAVDFWDEEIRTRESALVSRAGGDWQMLEEWDGLVAPERPEGALTAQAPQFLQRTEGWGVLEMGEDGVPWRWTYSEIATIELDRPLPAGSYTLYLHGFRFFDAPGDQLLKVELYGKDTRAVTDSPRGFFTLELPLQVPRQLEFPVLRLHQPLERVSDFYEDSADTRRVGLLLYHAWVEED